MKKKAKDKKPEIVKMTFQEALRDTFGGMNKKELKEMCRLLRIEDEVKAKVGDAWEGEDDED